MSQARKFGAEESFIPFTQDFYKALVGESNSRFILLTPTCSNQWKYLRITSEYLLSIIPRSGGECRQITK